MALDFPSNPTIGDEFTAGGFTWVWTGTTWAKEAAAAGGAANDFVLIVGNTGNTTYVLDKPYSAGRYLIDFVNNDTTYDIYFVAEDGTYAGYTNTDVAVVSATFEEVVVIGAAANETITFTYQGTSISPSTAGDVSVAGAFINSVVTTALPNINDSTVVNGGNFAANVQVSFVGQNDVETAAKTVVRNSSTQLIATRPDSFTTAQSPYDVKVVNPGIPAPTGSGRHILANSVTAGTNPAWVTGTTLFYQPGVATTLTLLASDTEASDIDYSIVSGTLPTGFTLDEETGVITGTNSAAEGTSTSVTFRATDAGGNFVDRTIAFVSNDIPSWTTAAGALTNANLDTAYSFQLVASTGSAGGTLSFTLQSGTLPTGLTLSSTGLISGTNTSPNGTNTSFTVRVTDQAGFFADRAFTIAVVEPALLWRHYYTGGVSYLGEPYIYSPTRGEFLAGGMNDNIDGNRRATLNRVNPTTGAGISGSLYWGDAFARCSALDLNSAGNVLMGAHEGGNTGAPRVYYTNTNLTQAWRIGATNAGSYINGVALDSSNNAYFAATLNSTPGSYPSLWNIGKTNSSGAVQWVRQISDTQSSPFSLVIDNNTDPIVIGKANNVSTTENTIVKYTSASGSREFARRVTNFALGAQLHKKANGNILIVGVSASGVPQWMEITSTPVDVVAKKQMTAISGIQRAYVSPTPSKFGGTWALWWRNSDETIIAHIASDNTINKAWRFSGFTHTISGLGSNPANDFIYFAERWTGEDGFGIGFTPWGNVAGTYNTSPTGTMTVTDVTSTYAATVSDSSATLATANPQDAASTISWSGSPGVSSFSTFTPPFNTNTYVS
jgi:hypothetical protein